MDHPDTIRSYMEALEEERQKIEVFRRELPLCLELVKQAIVGCKLQLSGASTEVMLHGQSECNSEQTTTGAHVLEEFIPLKSSRSHDGDYVEEDDDVDNDDEEQHSQMKKSDWLRSVQLWNPSPDSTPKEGPARPPPPKKAPLPAAEAKNHRGSNGAFHPLNKDIKAAGGKINNSSNSDSKQQLSLGDASPAADRTASSTAGGGAGCGPKKEEKQGHRKQRRCWSQELHRRFLHALQQLGGSHATPKQIRELMRVDGLTNDEVKSHLQKYRLHVRRPSAPVQNVNTLAPQFVVVGGIWMSPQDFTAAAASTKSVAEVAAANGMYAPVATVPQPFKQLHKKPQSMMNSDERSCEEEGVDHHSHSPPTSTSTHTSAEC